MKIAIESTDKLVTLVIDALTAEFEAELQRQADARVTVQAIPLRLIL